MRDFRDAKAMAQALREALKVKAVELTHSECLELVAKAFGYDNWNILAAKIESAQPRAPNGAPSSAAAPGAPQGEPQPEMFCTFCHKSQHKVRVLIAGPASTYICDECVELCDDILYHEDDEEIGSLLKADEESGNQAFPAAIEALRGKSAQEVAGYVERSRRGVERHRLNLRCIERRLALKDGDVPVEEEIRASLVFAHLKDTTKEDLLALRQQAERKLARHENALRIGLAMLAKADDGGRTTDGR